MVINHKPTGRAASIPMGLFIGSLFSAGLTLCSAAVLAKLVDLEKLAWNNIGYGIIVVLLVSSFSGAMIACHKIKRQRIAICAASGLIYFGLLLSVTALFFGGQYEAVGVTAALVLAGSLAAGLIEAYGNGSRKTPKRKWHNR